MVSINEKMPVVLIAMTSDDDQTRYKEKLGGKVILLQAHTLKEARDLFAQNIKDISVIVVGSYLKKNQDDRPSKKLNTCDLVEDFCSKGFNDRIIAASDDKNICIRLIQSGCVYDSKMKAVPAVVLKQLRELKKTHPNIPSSKTKIEQNKLVI